MNALEFPVLCLSNMLYALPEHSRPGNFEKYGRVVAASLICGEPLFMMSHSLTRNTTIEHFSLLNS